MTTGGELRRALDAHASAGDFPALALAYPNCACEMASAGVGSSGAVKDAEKLRYFITANSNVSFRANGSLRPITPNLFSRVFSKGVSVARLSTATREELEGTAAELHANQTAAHGDDGGVVGVLDFSASMVRRVLQDGSMACCVFDTPLPKKPSHADIAYHAVPTEEERTAIKHVLFNQVGGERQYTVASDVTDMDLSKFLPKRMLTA